MPPSILSSQPSPTHKHLGDMSTWPKNPLSGMSAESSRHMWRPTSQRTENKVLSKNSGQCFSSHHEEQGPSEVLRHPRAGNPQQSCRRPWSHISASEPPHMWSGRTSACRRRSNVAVPGGYPPSPRRAPLSSRPITCQLHSLAVAFAGVFFVSVKCAMCVAGGV